MQLGIIRGVAVVFAALAGASGSIGQIIGFRAGWGLGNALFVSTDEGQRWQPIDLRDRGRALAACADGSLIVGTDTWLFRLGRGSREAVRVLDSEPVIAVAAGELDPRIGGG